MDIESFLKIHNQTSMDQIVAGRVVGEYRLSRLLTDAELCVVWLGEHICLSTPVTIQIIDRQTLSAEGADGRLSEDINFLKRIDHPFIAKFFEVVEDYSYFYLIHEFPENGTLSCVIESRGPVPEIHGRQIFSQLVFAVEYLSLLSFRAPLIFSSDSILLDRHGNIRLHYSFGSFLVSAPPPLYLAPEVVGASSESVSAHLWSIGVILCQIVTGSLPFPDRHSISALPPAFPATLSPQLSDLLTKILHKIPSERITLERIKEHPWFSSAEYDCFHRLSPLTRIKRDVDMSVLEKMTQLGYDTKPLASAILSGENSPLLGPYELIRRDQLTERIADATNRMSATNDQLARAATNTKVIRAARKSPSKPGRIRESALIVPLPRGRGSAEPGSPDPRASRQGRLPLLLRGRTNSVVETSDDAK
jgi:serine/threonine protein kinase